MAPTSRMAEASLGKTPTTPDRRLDFFVDALEGVGGPDLLPVSYGEPAEREHVVFGAVHQRACFGEAGGELVSDLVPGVAHGVGVGLREDRAEHCGSHVLVGAGHQGQRVIR